MCACFSSNYSSVMKDIVLEVQTLKLFRDLNALSVFDGLCISLHNISSFMFSSHRCVGNNIMLLTKAFKKKFIIPEFAEFTQQIDRMYDSAQQQEAGQVSSILTNTNSVSSHSLHLTLTQV